MKRSRAVTINYLRLRKLTSDSTVRELTRYMGFLEAGIWMSKYFLNLSQLYFKDYVESYSRNMLADLLGA